MTRRRYNHSYRRRGHSFLALLFKKWPSWLVWTTGGALAVVYIYFMYAFLVAPYSFRWKAIFGDSEVPPGYEIHGIDISHYQGEIQWSKLKNAEVNGYPINFVIVKSTEGSSMIDENFNDNFYQAREHGFLRGAYHFYSTKTPARKQAKYFLKQVHLENGDLPPVLDVESTGNLSEQEFRKEILRWLKIVEKAYKCKPILYTGYKFKMAHLSGPEFDDYPYWIAHYYVSKVRYKGKWKFWQHTDAGKVDGIKGYVDLNIYNGSMYDLQKMLIEK